MNSASVGGPIIVLHDHLDGGVRPQTVLDLAAEHGVEVPAADVDELAEWFTIIPGMPFVEAFSRFDLVGAVLQTPEALARVALEAVEDLAADGVIHAELRFAPMLHTLQGMTPVRAIEAVDAGLADAAAMTGLDALIIVCAMRDQPEDVSIQAIQAAIDSGCDRVVGVDLAGAEVGHPAEDHAAALSLAHRAGLSVTIHAGEMDGAHQVASALDTCAPDRIGHGWRIIDDCVIEDDRIVALGPTATALRASGAPLEICLTSNACLGMPVAEHPVRLLRDAGFRVTLNPDDRAITTTSARRELELAAEHHGFTRHDLAQSMERAAVGAFLPDEEKTVLVERVRSGWDVVPARIVHLAERGEWEAARSTGSYLPGAFAADGFIHLSSLHQLLTPANRFYAGRTDLVALVIDTHFLGRALVWEPGTGTDEHFPHLYAALTPEAVLGEFEMMPGADGDFLLPADLVRAVGG
jgi:adenosine deaminase